METRLKDQKVFIIIINSHKNKVQKKLIKLKQHHQHKVQKRIIKIENQCLEVK